MAGSRTLDPSLLDEANAALIQGGVSITAGSRTAENVPVMARAFGCRVSANRQTITLLFYTPSAEEFLEGIRGSKQIAVVFSKPSTHHTIQLKGNDAVVVPERKADIKVAEQYIQAFVDHLRPLGYPEPLVRALFQFETDKLTAVTFTPSEAFSQTPGPRAGEPLKGGPHAHSG
jgi:hypothetical protein